MRSIFTASWAVRAYIAVAAVGLTAPIIGSFLVQRRLSLIGDGIGHLAFAGVAIGVALSIAPVWGALGTAILGALALERLRTKGRIAGDLALAFVFYGALAFALVLLSLRHRLDASAIGVLFGNPYVASWGDVITIVALCAVAVVAIVPFYPQLLAVALDEETARAAGLPVDGLNLLTVTLTALLVAAGMRVVGLLLIASLLVIPIAAGSRLAHSFRRTISWGVVVGVVSCLGGLLFALGQGNVHPGGTMVLASIAGFVAASVAGRRAARRHPRQAGS
jgi:zinc transport system permease protein